MLKLPSHINYSWVIIFSGICGLFASLGLGRFSLGMMLPSMGEELGISYSQMGIISTLNFCGYLGAVLLAGTMERFFGARCLIFLALGLVGTSMILIGNSSSYYIIVCLYFITGVGSALSNVPIMALVSTWFSSARRGRVAGLMVMGNGLGILFSGKSIPLINGFGGGWQLSWQVLGGIVVLVALLCLVLIRNHPNQQSTILKNNNSVERKSSMSKGLLIHCGGIYFLFGFSYVIYVTFMITSLVEERGLTEQAAGDLWSCVGFLSLISGPFWGYISDAYGRKRALVIVFLIQAVAYILVSAHLPIFAVYLSICCFSIVAWSIPSIIAALLGDYAGPEKTAAMFGYVTFLFGLGQILGPTIAGYLAETSHSFSLSFLMAALMATMGAGLSLILPAEKKTI